MNDRHLCVNNQSLYHLKQNNYENKGFVDHIDNDKLNNKVTNLQWIKSYRRTENSKIDEIEGEIWKNIID